MVGAIVGAGISAVGSLAGGAMQSGNASSAAKTSQRNLELMLPQIQQNYVNQQGLFQPFYGAGQQGLGAETDLLGLNGPDAAAAAMQRYQTSPGYQWQMEQGLRGVDAGAAAKGMLRSGATLKAEDIFAQGLANSDFGQYYNRLMDLSKMGQTAAGQEADIGQNLIANMQGNATAQNSLATGAANAQNSILGNTFGGLSNTVNTLLSRPGVDKTISGWFGGGSSSQPNMGVVPTPSGGFNPSGNTWYW